jgi:hypothetical protein
MRYNINLKGADIMNQKLRGQFVKVPSKKISKVVNKTVDINPKSTMNELLENPKLVKTLQKLSLV